MTGMKRHNSTPARFRFRSRLSSWSNARCAVILLATGLAVGLVAPSSTFADGLATGPRKVDFIREGRPSLVKNCFTCHGPDEVKRAKELRLDQRESATKPLASGEAAIVPGDPDSSSLYMRITEEDETLRMPPRKAGGRLTRAE